MSQFSYIGKRSTTNRLGETIKYNLDVYHMIFVKQNKIKIKKEPFFKIFRQSEFGGLYNIIVLIIWCILTIDM